MCGVRQICLVLMSMFLCVPAAPAIAEPLSVIPLPQRVQLQRGQFELNARTRIFAMDAGAQDNARILQQAVKAELGLALPMVLGMPDARAKNVIVFAQVLKSKEAFDALMKVLTDASKKEKIHIHVKNLGRVLDG